MKDQLVSFEIAKLAKEKGFDIKCDYWKYIDNNCQAMSYDSQTCISIPTQSLLQKWLREKHKIRIYPEQKTAGDFGFVIYILNSEPEKRAGLPWIRLSYFTLHFDLYEEALETGLLNALNLIKI